MTAFPWSSWGVRYRFYASSGKEMVKVLSSSLPVQTAVCVLQANKSKQNEFYAACCVLVVVLVWF